MGASLIFEMALQYIHFQKMQAGIQFFFEISCFLTGRDRTLLLFPGILPGVMIQEHSSIIPDGSEHRLPQQLPAERAGSGEGIPGVRFLSGVCPVL